MGVDIRSAYPIWRDVIGSNPNDIRIALVLRSVESETGLPRQDVNKSLLGYEFPRQGVACICVEVDTYSLRSLGWYKPSGLESTCADLGRAGKASSGAEHPVQGDCSISYTQGCYYLLILRYRLCLLGGYNTHYG